MVSRLDTTLTVGATRGALFFLLTLLLLLLLLLLVLELFFSTDGPLSSLVLTFSLLPVAAALLVFLTFTLLATPPDSVITSLSVVAFVFTLVLLPAPVPAALP